MPKNDTPSLTFHDTVGLGSIMDKGQFRYDFKKGTKQMASIS